MLIPLTIAPSQRGLSATRKPVNVLWPGALALALHLRRVGFLYCYRLMLRSLELMAVEVEERRRASSETGGGINNNLNTYLLNLTHVPFDHQEMDTRVRGLVTSLCA
jgi:hypothetical protein